MIAFQSAREAVRCAIRIQRAFARRNAGAQQAVHLRIGLHTGELVREGDDFFGRHVNFAARIGSESDGGEIVASSILHELVGPCGEFRFHTRGSVKLKGLKGKHQLHSVEWRHLEQSPAAGPERRMSKQRAAVRHKR